MRRAGGEVTPEGGWSSGAAPGLQACRDPLHSRRVVENLESLVVAAERRRARHCRALFGPFGHRLPSAVAPPPPRPRLSPANTRRSSGRHVTHRLTTQRSCWRTTNRTARKARRRTKAQQEDKRVARERGLIYTGEVLNRESHQHVAGGFLNQGGLRVAVSI